MDGVVGEMDIVVLDIAERVFLSRCADVALAKEVELERVGKESPNTDVNFATRE